METLHYTVIKDIKTVDFSHKNTITNQGKKVLASLQIGEIIEAKRFVKEIMPKFCNTINPRNIANVGYRYLREGKKLGILSENPKEEKSISFENFIEIESVAYWISQLSTTKYKNLKTNKILQGTQGTHGYHLWAFNEWLQGKTFRCRVIKQIANDSFSMKDEEVTFETVQDMLELYKMPNSNRVDFIKIIKGYLLDPINSKHKAGYITSRHSAILSYFRENDYPLEFKFNSKNKFDTTNSQDDIVFGIDEFVNLITLGGASITEKAVMLCKLHRGLDASTLCENFNFYAWEQIVEHFGTEDHTKWDIKTMCPVPIKLTRLKSDFSHVGFLEYDAIKSIQDYLEYREAKTGIKMTENSPLFLNKFGGAINPHWISDKFTRLATNAGLLNNSKKQGRPGSHECRDLLKTIFLENNVTETISEHLIGHKTDSYSKQHKIYPESLKENYKKISSTLNVFSNMSSHRKGNGEQSKIKEELRLQKKQTQQTIQSNQEIKENVEKILSYLQI